MNTVQKAQALCEAAFTIERQHMPLDRSELDLVRAWINISVKAAEGYAGSMAVIGPDGVDRTDAALRVLHMPMVVATRLMVTLENLGFINDVAP